MTQNQNNSQTPNYTNTQYNRDYYSQSGQNYDQSEYVPQSYGVSNRYDDLYDYEEESGSKDFLIGALVGGIIGAATALFLAPKSGKELRENLNTQASSLKEKASQNSGSDSDSSGGFTQQIKDQSSKVVDKVKNLKGGGTSPMDDGTASSEGEETIEMLDTVQNTVDQAETAGQDAFASTASALKEAVEEVKEEKKKDQSNSGSSSNSGNSGNANSSKNSGNSGSNKSGSGKSNSGSNSKSSSNSNSGSNSNKNNTTK